MPLNRQKLRGALRSAVSADSVPDCITRTKVALKTWLQSSTPEEQPQKLFIPLEHSYAKENLCFAGLKCKDAYLAEVLKGYTKIAPSDLLLELHLCIVAEHVTHKEDCDDDGASDFEITNWVGIDDRKVNLSGIDIDVCTELLEDADDIFKHDREPDVEDFEQEEDYLGNYHEISYFSYHKPMLVLWPCKRTLTVVGTERVDEILDMIETKISRGERTEAETLLRDLLKLLRMHSIGMVGANVFPCKICKTNARFLLLVSKVGGCKDMVKVMEIIGGKSCGHGITSMEVVTMIALAYHTHGWDACGDLIVKKFMRKSDVKIGCEYCAHLAMQFCSLKMPHAAMSIAKKVYALIIHQDVRELTASAVAAILVMFFALPECGDEFASVFASSIPKKITTVALCAVIVKLKDEDNKNVFSLKENPISMGIFTKFCYELSTRNLNVQQKAQCSHCRKVDPDTIKKYVVAVMEVFLWLENGSLLEDMVQSFLIQAQSTKTQVVLRDIIGSNSFWQKACASKSGSKALRNLVKERIRKLASQRKPVFSSFATCSEKQRQARCRFFEKSEMEWYAGQRELEKLRQSIEAIPLPTLDVRYTTENEDYDTEVTKRQKIDPQAREPFGSTKDNPIELL
ncbi:hypothetical protein L7F22_051303 [Adiantum nelumboides]|nr:hypothetical protein [Adiantum nelumboides]